MTKGKRRILSIQPGKGSDKIISVGYVDDQSLYSSGGVVEQYVRRDWAAWYRFPDMEKVDFWPPFETLYDEYKARQVYAAESPTTVAVKTAVKAKKSAVNCSYCRAVMQDKAQLCLHCGTMICMPCAPEVAKCPTLGCKP